VTVEQEPISAAFPDTAGGLVHPAPPSVLHLRQAVERGAPWHQALLEAVGLWTMPREVYQGRNYHYLIRGEAFDWLLLAERLCNELKGVIPPEDEEALLFNGQLPDGVSDETFRELIGSTKHRAHRNYWYGVVLEEALQLAVEEEVRKQHLARCYPDNEDLVEMAFAVLYGKTRNQAWELFRQESETTAFTVESAQWDGLGCSLTNLKEFTYWLFKYRVHYWDPARVASDTRKAMLRLDVLEQGEKPLTASVLGASHS
jgi:hypothetical protein